MVERPRFFDDLAGVAGGALSALAGMREELEAMVRARTDEALRHLALVRREELDAVTELAANARAGQEAAEARLAALEVRVAALEIAAAGDAADGKARATPAEANSAPTVGAASGPTTDATTDATPGTASGTTSANPGGATEGTANEAPGRPAA
jgi:BMFP domain-containing protein YqiC